MGHPGKVLAHLLVGAQDPKVQLAPPRLGQIALDRQAGEFMPEGHRLVAHLQNPPSHRLIQSRVERNVRPLSHAQLQSAGSDRHDFNQMTGRVSKPSDTRPHHVSDCCWDPFGVRSQQF